MLESKFHVSYSTNKNLTHNDILILPFYVFNCQVPNSKNKEMEKNEFLILPKYVKTQILYNLNFLQCIGPWCISLRVFPILNT